MRKHVLSMFVAAAIVLGPALAGGPVSSASARSTAPSPVVGHYRIHYNWSNTGFTPDQMLLRRDHTGFIGLRNRIPLTWSTTGAAVTLVLDGGETTYHGTVSAAGFDTRKAPGTMSSVKGYIGTWYAVRVVKR